MLFQQLAKLKMIKKQSLFKQKLRQQKLKQISSPINHNKQTVQSFPKTFKLDSYESTISNQQVNRINPLQPSKTKNHSSLTQDSFMQQSYLQRYKQSLQGVMSSDQIQQIDQQNWNAINTMKQQQRLNYINLIQNTLPMQFINKLKKKNNSVLPKQQKKYQKIIQKNERVEMRTSVVQKIQQRQFSQGHKHQSIISTICKQQKSQQQSIEGEHAQILNHLYLQVKQGKLVYLSQAMILTLSKQEKQNIISKSSIIQLLTSQNNQSQIIGSHLLMVWLKNVFPSEKLVFTVSQVPFHVRIMLQEMYDILRQVQNVLKSTKFYSCYIEMLVKAVEVVTLVYQRLNDQELHEQILFFAHQLQSAKKALSNLLTHNQRAQNDPQTISNPQQQQQKQMLYQSLKILHEVLQQQIIKRKQLQQNIKNLDIISIDQRFQFTFKESYLQDIVQAILIEQTLGKQDFEKYNIQPAINNFLITIIQYWNVHITQIQTWIGKKINRLSRFYQILYKLIQRLNTKQRNFPFYKPIIKQIFQSIMVQLQSKYIQAFIDKILYKQENSLSTIEQHKNQTNYLLFYALSIYKQLSQNSNKFAQFLQKEREKWILNTQQAYIIIYLNFEHYLHVSDLSIEEILMLEKMLVWLKNTINQNINLKSSIKLNAEEVLLSLLNLFLSDNQEIYSLLDQAILTDTLSTSVIFYELFCEKSYKKYKQIKPNQILPENQLKKLVQNYNFNSFGNDIFTKVLIWIAVSFSQEIQYFVGQQVMMRYPMLFYYACQSQGENSNSTNNYPLLGKLSKYIACLQKVQHSWFISHKSNIKTKASILKLLALNLQFASQKQLPAQVQSQIFNEESLKATGGFNCTKKPLNLNNYFYKYLIQPFMRIKEYKQQF